MRNHPLPSFLRQSGELGGVEELLSAEYRNKLATASDWVVATEKAGNLEDAKDLAGELITCVDGSVAGLDVDYMSATEIAAACLVIMEP